MCYNILYKKRKEFLTMTVKQQELFDIIQTLPEDFLNKTIEYIEYLKYSYIVNNAPKNLIIKDRVDLRNKLEEGIKDTESGKVCSIDEAFSEIDTILAQ